MTTPVVFDPYRMQHGVSLSREKNLGEKMQTKELNTRKEEMDITRLAETRNLMPVGNSDDVTDAVAQFMQQIALTPCCIRYGSKTTGVVIEK